MQGCSQTRQDIVDDFFSSMTFCRRRDFVIKGCFDTHKLCVVDYKSLSITKYELACVQES